MGRPSNEKTATCCGQWSKDPINRVLGLKYYSINGIWALKPHDLVVSQNKGTPILTPKYYSPYPQKGTPNFGNPPFGSFESCS